MAILVNQMLITGFLQGLLFGFFAWLGFALFLHLNSKMFEKRPINVFLLMWVFI